MIIKCKKTKRFLCKINYDDILDTLDKLGIQLDKPLEITIPCKNCKTSEIYHIYKDHYIFKGNDEK